MLHALLASLSSAFAITFLYTSYALSFGGAGRPCSAAGPDPAWVDPSLRKSRNYLNKLVHAQTYNQVLLPVIVNTWEQNGFSKAAEAAWQALKKSNSRLDAVEAGCRECEDLQCDGTVGFGGSPDERGETTLDAFIMDGPNHEMGAVGDLRRVKNAIGVARAVMNYTKHSLLVGESATQFALEMGFQETNLSTSESVLKWKLWEHNKCQPNYRQNVIPNPRTSCGPYSPASSVDHWFSFVSLRDRKDDENARPTITSSNHDTVGMLVVDENGDIAVGTSTNGAIHKVPGRVGDSPIPGAGAYVDNDVGGAAETGDGDVMMRFLPSYQTVEFMRSGSTPEQAAAKAIHRIASYYPKFEGAIIAVSKFGEVGAACHGLINFPYTVRRTDPDHVQILYVNCTS